MKTLLAALLFCVVAPFAGAQQVAAMAIGLDQPTFTTLSTALAADGGSATATTLSLSYQGLIANGTYDPVVGVLVLNITAMPTALSALSEADRVTAVQADLDAILGGSGQAQAFWYPTDAESAAFLAGLPALLGVD